MNAFQVVGEYVLKGAEKVSDQINSVSEEAENSQGKLGGLGDKLDSVADKTDKAGNTLTKFVTGPLAGAAAGAVGLAKKAGDMADSLLDARDATGMSLKTLQEWQYVTGQAGVSSDIMEKAAIRLNRRMDQLKEGKGNAARAAERFDINMQKLTDSSVSMDEKLMMLQKSFAEMDSEQKRAEAGSLLFGKRWEQMAPIFNMSTKQLKKMREEGAKYAQNEEDINKANKFRASLEKLQSTFKALSFSVGADLAGVMNDTLIPMIENSAIPVTESLVGSFETFLKTIQMIPEPVLKLVAKITALAAVVGPLLKTFSLLVGVFQKVIALKAVATTFSLISASLSPFLVVIGLVAAAVAAIVLIFKNWDKIIESLKDAWRGFKMLISDAASVIKSAVSKSFDWIVEKTKGLIKTFKELPGNIYEAIKALPGKVWSILGSLGTKMINWAKNVVSDIIQSFKNMYNELVGNSIVPDMRADVVHEMKGMSNDSAKVASEMSKGVESGLEDTGSEFDLNGNSGNRKSQRNYTSGDTYIDARNSVFKDDADLRDRMKRRGQRS